MQGFVMVWHTRKLRRDSLRSLRGGRKINWLIDTPAVSRNNLAELTSYVIFNLYLVCCHIGESYMDVTLRLEQIVLDIERTREPILIVGKNFDSPPCALLALSNKANITICSSSRYPPTSVCLFHGAVTWRSTICKHSIEYNHWNTSACIWMHWETICLAKQGRNAERRSRRADYINANARTFWQSQ